MYARSTVSNPRVLLSFILLQQKTSSLFALSNIHTHTFVLLLLSLSLILYLFYNLFYIIVVVCSFMAENARVCIMYLQRVNTYLEMIIMTTQSWNIVAFFPISFMRYYVNAGLSDQIAFNFNNNCDSLDHSISLITKCSTIRIPRLRCIPRMRFYDYNLYWFPFFIYLFIFFFCLIFNSIVFVTVLYTFL
jgi:hypothetical protein